jgi:hypothetical protein
MYIPIAQCKHIFFGPCHDNGYLTVFEQYRRDTANASRLTLIETRPSESGFKQLGFKICSMKDVFRDTDLPLSRTQLPQSPAVTTTRTPLSAISKSVKPGSPVYSTDSKSSTGGSTWGTIARGNGTNKSINIASKPAPLRSFILLNVNDERLDVDLQRVDYAAELRYAKRMEEKGKVGQIPLPTSLGVRNC